MANQILLYERRVSCARKVFKLGVFVDPSPARFGLGLNLALVVGLGLDLKYGSI